MVTDSIFVGGLAPAGVKDGMRHKWGFIRPNARFAIEPTFDFAGPFIGGLVAVVASGSAQRFDMYVDVGGRVVWSASP